MKVSVIIPAYNVERYIGACLRSVVNQSHTDWEAIVIDDGSTDGTRAVAETFQDPRIRVLGQTNAGVSAARNRGLDAATGDVVTFLDADDLLPTRSLTLRLARLVEAEQEDDAQDYVVHGPVVVFDDATLDTRVLRVALEDREKTFVERLADLDSTAIVNVGLLLRRHVVGKTRFDIDLRYFEDIDFFFRIALQKPLRQVVTRKPIYGYRLRGGSAMKNEAALFLGINAYIERIKRLALVEPAGDSEGERIRNKTSSKQMATSLSRLRTSIRIRRMMKPFVKNNAS